MKFMKKIIIALLSISLITTAVACGDDGKEDSAVIKKEIKDKQKELVTNYLKIGLQAYTDSYNEAVKLQSAIDKFVETPTEDNFNAAKKAWLKSREPYLQTEIYRFYDGPINQDHKGGELEPFINAWPLDENYIDYTLKLNDKGQFLKEDGSTTENPAEAAINTEAFNKSIIGNDQITISAEELRELNEKDGEKNISTGYHAIEFMLWGQDFYDDSAGKRAFTDYTTAPKAERRKKYLKVVTDMLVEDLKWIKDQWTNSTWKTNFEKDPQVAFTKMMISLRMLVGFETGGERVTAALNTQNQEEEHSCFSDNTHRDMIQDIQGMINVYVGKYVTVENQTISGVGVKDVVAIKNKEVAGKIGSLLQSSLEKATKAARVERFDVSISKSGSDGFKAVTALAEELSKTDAEIKKVFDFSVFELNLNDALDESEKENK